MGRHQDFLRKRAQEFWERAKEDYARSRFNLAALDVEQAIQLWFKDLIYRRAGDFPKTYDFGVLLNELAHVSERPELIAFYERRALEFRAIEDAYITSRYLPREFSQTDVLKMLEFGEAIIGFVKETLGEKLV
ncbi:MAG: HEPN domain-containing protein [candidate division KSB1 bacterium]|nr:HEPN domain-containing protein [candidate division KSB1 bacterium]